MLPHSSSPNLLQAALWLALPKPGFGNSLPTVLPSLLSQDMNNLDEGVEFLPAMNSKKMEKRGPKRQVVITVLIIVFLLVSLTTGLLVWHFKCECDVWWVLACRVTPWERIHPRGKALLPSVAHVCPLKLWRHHSHLPAPIAVTGDLLGQIPALTALPDPELFPSRQEHPRPEGFQWPLEGSELGIPGCL